MDELRVEGGVKGQLEGGCGTLFKAFDWEEEEIERRLGEHMYVGREGSRGGLGLVQTLSVFNTN